MEEKKNAQGKAPEKMSYEDLARVANELSVQNKDLVKYVQQLQGALAENDFNRISFFLSMLFKVMEHAEMYSADFVDWSVKKIETALHEFDEQVSEESKKDEAK